MDTNLSQITQARSLDQYKLAIITISSLLGLDKFKRPDELEVTTMVSYMRKYLAAYRPDEFVKAFEMLIAGLLDVDPQTIKSISPIHLVNVMQSYSRYNINKKNPLMLSEKNELTQQEKDSIMLSSALDIFHRMATSRVYPHEFHWSIFNFLSGMGVLKFSKDNQQLLGRIPDGSELVIESTANILEMARQDVYEAKTRGVVILGDIIMRQEHTGITDIMVRQRARGIAVKQYYIALIIKKHNLKDVIETIKKL